MRDALVVGADQQDNNGPGNEDLEAVERIDEDQKNSS